MGYQSSKTYGHDVGLSCCFRQWKAESHCHFLHGYALKVHLEFVCDELDERNWVMDFGGLKQVKEWLQSVFDHKTLVDKHDPLISSLRELHQAGVIDMIIVDQVGCEAFAKMVYDYVKMWLLHIHGTRVRLLRAEVHEHGANSASYGEGQ